MRLDIWVGVGVPSRGCHIHPSILFVSRTLYQSPCCSSRLTCSPGRAIATIGWLVLGPLRTLTFPLATITPIGTGVKDGVAVGVRVGVGVCVGLDVTVGLLVEVGVGVDVCVELGINVGVLVGIEV